MTNDNDLRTALTKLADEHDAQTGPYARILHTVEIRALLAAHPAEVVSDTRREIFYCPMHGDLLALGERRSARCREAAPGHEFSTLPAPPVVDEGQIQDIIREAYDTHIDLGSPARRGEFVFTAAEVIAARLRGATRG